MRGGLSRLLGARCRPSTLFRAASPAACRREPDFPAGIVRVARFHPRLRHGPGVRAISPAGLATVVVPRPRCRRSGSCCPTRSGCWARTIPASWPPQQHRRLDGTIRRRRPGTNLKRIQTAQSVRARPADRESTALDLHRHSPSRSNTDPPGHPEDLEPGRSGHRHASLGWGTLAPSDRQPRDSAD